MRRVLFWTAVVAALAALVGGGLFAYVTYRSTDGPGGAVRGYFAALARSDAPAALAYGTVPPGPRGLLTSAVLAQQQKIAPIVDVQIIEVTHTGDRASVRYSYRLGFAAGSQEFTGTLPVADHGNGWRLARTALSVTLRLDQARDRIALAGTAVPDGPTLLFPGALPVRIDTPHLQLDPTTAAVQFGGGPTMDVDVLPSPAAQTALAAQLAQQLDRCVRTATASSICPLPATRVVPGSLAGRIVGDLGQQVAYRVGADAAGTITMIGTTRFSGTYGELDYDNVLHTRSGTLALPVDAVASAVGPLTVHFQEVT